MQILLDAMSQLFFSLSVSMGIMITYGSYVKPDVNLNRAVNQIEFFDTGVALLAGAMIIPAVYVFSGVEGMGAGPSLMFVSLPKAGASLQNFHLECEDDIQATLDKIRSLGCKTGLTIKPGTPPEALLPYLDQLDLVLVMSVEPGFGGQKFMPSALDKLRFLAQERQRRGAHYLLQVDGGVDDTTAPLCVEAGADVLVAGSAIFGAKDPAAAVARLAAL